MQAMRKSEALYDFSALEPSRQKQPPQLKVVPGKSAACAAQPHLGAAAFVLAAVVMVLSLIIYNNMVLTELGDRLNAYTSEFEALKSENSRMQVELEGKMSLRKVEEYASGTLGMTRIGSYQVEYGNLGAGDKIELVKSENESLWGKIRQAAEPLLEYIRN